MPLKRNITGYHVRAYPVTQLLGIPYGASPEDQRKNCEHIAAMIRKHITKRDDECEGAEVIQEIEEVCEFCESPWTEAANAPHNGGCCDEDAALMPVEEAA